MIDFSGVLRDEDPELTSIATDSGLRSQDPDALRARLEPTLWNYGITRVAHLTGFDCMGVPVHMATKPQGRTLSSGSGKGTTTQASWLSAVMEASEQAVWEDLESSGLVASQAALGILGHDAIDCSRLPQSRGGLWTEDFAMPWARGWDIVSGRSILVPEVMVLSSRSDAAPFQAGSNGLASGAHVLEAVLSGLQEVIERDALVMNTMVRKVPGVDASALVEERTPAIAEIIESTKVELVVMDATTDIGVPAMVAYLYDAVGSAIGNFKGMGCASDTGTALTRAVTEAFQSRCLVVAGARDDVFASQRRSATTWPRTAGEDHSPTGGPVEVRDHRTGSVLGDIEWMVERLRACGFDQVIVLRHTEPADPVQVVRVIVPGLEAYPFAGYALGPRARQYQAELQALEMSA